MYRFLMIFISVFLLISSSAFAAEMANLYVAEQRVASQDEAARNTAATQALQHVLLKVVGDRAPLESISLEAVSEVAPSLVTGHEYFNANAAKAAHDNTAPEELAVRFQFDQDKVNQQLLAWGLPVWNTARPEVLLLIIQEDKGDRNILTDESILADVALNMATMRGIPALLPLMDLDDYGVLALADLWAGDYNATKPFARRYQTPLVVVARMAKQSGEQWRIQWQYNAGGEVVHWQSRGSDQAAMEDGMASLADNLARQFSHIKAAQATPFLLEIEGVLGFVLHQRVMAFLSGLSYAEKVQQLSLTQGVLTVALDYFGHEAALRAVISGDDLLTPMASFENADRLYYQVTP